MSLLFSTGAIAGSAAKGAPGMVLLTPTSITHSGTSASIGANGQVTFTAVTSLSLNGVFSADFDNYVMSIRAQSGVSPSSACNLLMRGSGTDATGSDYTRQRLLADNTTVSAVRNTGQSLMDAFFIAYDSVNQNGNWFSIYGPFLASPTAARGNVVFGYQGAYIFETAFTHSVSTSYDGFTITTAGSITGALQVYGIRS